MAMALVVMLGAALAGCQTSSGYYDPAASAAGGMVGGAAAGAALGSIIGAATGNPGTGAWIGAASGAAAGGLAGSIYARDQNQNIARAQAAQPEGPPPGYNPGYAPPMGNAVAIDQVYVQPNRVRPGTQIMLTMKYRVINPQNQPVPVQLVREISKDGQLINQPYQEERQVPNGTYGARVAYNVPPDFPPGNYVATFRVLSSLGTAEKSVYFSVQ
ncbi:MAG: YMGG-like glycine zipper-containing protein [Thermodesulfobacteriota bacterium]